METRTNDSIYDVYNDFINRISDDLTMLSVAKLALYQIVDPAIHYKKVFPELAGKKDKLEKLLEKINKDSQNNIAKEISEFVRRESVNDFPGFYKPYSILIWTYLETFIKNLLAVWAKTHPEILKTKLIQESYHRVQKLPNDEKFYALLDSLEFRIRDKSSLGVQKFENMLALFDLAGSVDVDIANAILELQQVRNLLIHRRGIVDTKILSAVDWVVSYGEDVFIDDEIFDWYVTSALKYAQSVMGRAVSKLNNDIPIG